MLIKLVDYKMTGVVELFWLDGSIDDGTHNGWIALALFDARNLKIDANFDANIAKLFQLNL